MRTLLTAFVVALSLSATAETREHTFGDKAKDFGTVYVAQWIVFGFTQAETIRDHGRLMNMIEYPSQPHFDNDDYNYNVIKHAISGNYYYLFYKWRGYDTKEAFVGAFASSLAFEFAIETLTEKPSYQDIYQTPVFGTVLGIGAEHASEYLRSSENKFVQAIGYMLNPFAVLPHDFVQVIPDWTPGQTGIKLLADF